MHDLASRRGGIRAAWLALVLAGGCYSYEPVQVPQPGMEVRARLKTESAVRRSEGLDEPVMVVNGRVIDATPESVMLNVLLARDPSVFRNVEIRDTVRLNLDEIQTLTVRHVSTTRSLLFAGALGVGGFLVVRGISSIVGGSEGEDPGTPQVNVTPAAGRSRPAIQFRLPFPRR